MIRKASPLPGQGFKACYRDQQVRKLVSYSIRVVWISSMDLGKRLVESDSAESSPAFAVTSGSSIISSIKFQAKPTETLR
jgi:hypothetical protein